MHPSKENEAYAKYRAEIAGEHMVPALRAAILVILGVTAAFPAVDWVAFPSQFWEIALVRLVLAVFLLGLWFRAPHCPETTMLAVVVVEGIHLVVVIGLAGGVSSPYYPGMMLLVLGLPALLPVTAKQAISTLGPLFALFSALPLLGSVVPEKREYMMSLSFVGGSVVVAVISAWLLDQLRFRDHWRRSEITAARDELAKLDEAKTRFTASIHHELRTPLTLVLAPLEGIRAGEYGGYSPDVGRVLNTIHSNGMRLLKLINDLLDLAKLESQQFSIHRTSLEIGELVVSVVEAATPMARRKEVDISFDITRELPTINADRALLEKVLVNLIGNALKFTKPGGRIFVGASPGEGGVNLWVRDTGIGLARDQLSRIFDRFAQVDASATREYEGTGIGLSLSRELVDLHEGRIWAKSEGKGCGTTMHIFLPTGSRDNPEVELPIVATDSSGAAIGEGSIEGAEPGPSFDIARQEMLYVELEKSVDRSNSGPHESVSDTYPPMSSNGSHPVLVVDDNPEMRELVSFILRKEFSVVTARNGREAIQEIARADPDLVVTDIMMPEMSGTELCAAIKRNPDSRETPVILVSSRAESEMKIAGLELGADDYVTKPFHPRELIARVRSLVDLRRAQRELAWRNHELENALAELQHAEDQLVQSERLAAVGELAAGIAHEVNNPVNYALNASRAIERLAGEIDGFVQRVAALNRTIASSRPVESTTVHHDPHDLGDMMDELKKLTMIVASGLERTHKLVSDLRDFAAPGRNGARSLVDIRDGLRSAVQLLSHSLRESRVEVELLFPVDLGAIRADPGALNQIFLNLIKNSAEAMEPSGGRITVEVMQEADNVRVKVRDTGPGVAASARDRLFEPFFTTKEAGRGTGLGLSTSRRIALAHGGRLEVDTDAEEGGGCFVLTLPLDSSGVCLDHQAESDS